MFCARLIYRAFTSCCSSRSVPQEPTIPSNEAIQERLVSRRIVVSEEERARTWDAFTSMSEEDYYDSDIESVLPKCRGKEAYDLGAGRGTDTRFLLKSGWRVTAVDISPKAIALLKAQATPHLEVLQGGIETVPFTKKADLILALDVLAFCHPERVQSVWDRMHATLQEGGYLVCTLPVPQGGSFANWDMSNAEAMQFFVQGKYKVIRWQESDNPYTDHPLRLILQKV